MRFWRMLRSVIEGKNTKDTILEVLAPEKTRPQPRVGVASQPQPSLN